MHSGPWFRKQDNWWYFYRREGGRRRQIRLVEGRRNRKAAFDRWHELCRQLAEEQIVATDSAVALLDLYLSWVQKNRSAGTYGIYLHHLTSFGRSIGPKLSVAELKPKHVTAWLDSLTAPAFVDSTKAGAAQTVRTAFHWLVREGHISVNPVAGAKGPARRQREVILSADEYAAILKHSRPDFVDLLEFLRATGCRPQEAVAVEAKHCQLDQRRIVFPPSQAKGKKHPRVIYLNDKALAIVRRLCTKYPHGKILRNSKGKPWNRDMVRQRFLRLREKVGANFCAYHLRHTFATDALQRLDPITVASLMGHADASTLARNYQHLAKLPAYMQERPASVQTQAWQAIQS
jgi:integrase